LTISPYEYKYYSKQAKFPLFNGKFYIPPTCSLIIASNWSGRITLDLQSWGDSDNTADAAAGIWENEVILKAASGATLTTAHLGRVTLRNFWGNWDQATKSITSLNGGYKLELSANSADNTASLVKK
jgi:hypothetical protein